MMQLSSLDVCSSVSQEQSGKTGKKLTEYVSQETIVMMKYRLYADIPALKLVQVHAVLGQH